MNPDLSAAEATPELSVVIATHDNLAMLRRCLDGWRRHATGAPVELIVIADGCRDGTDAYLDELARTDWGRAHLRWGHTPDVHELMCTNLGISRARAPLVMSWHDDMFLQAGWFVPELLSTFREIPELGLLCLSRGLNFTPVLEPLETWHDTIDWKRVQSTIGPAPLNWMRIHEVDAVIRPWVVRKECIAKVGALDEAFRPTEWDEADLAYRIRAAGWKVGAHGYERDRAYEHAVSSTLGRTPSERRMALGLRNAKLFFERWGETIRREHPRERTHWRRRATAAGWRAMLAQAARHAAGRGQAG
ncbi:glycosyltransferase family 2 protein [Longimicrobium sp.]|uniref:glycosyltransferase family 2 protein n=1 Tax=Longimicrobium sp. TaxID=2029185 RepID=UPI002C4026D4|nr:glycosyltransferase [Longimicrobium sp.]HSU15211.1 glycosyltransferase [Longimicrobium sp.]